MPQLVKKRRSGWAVLAAGALVASLLAVGASPAAAVNKDSKANNPSETSACVGPALADAGFTDTSGLGAEAAINCLAYYGITTGKTADKFDPGSNVTREQMALFLHRTANVAGVDLSGGGATPGFSDLGEVGADRQAAINALARNGILMGRTATTFVPAAEITRAEMAHALINLLTKVPGSGVAKATNGTYTLTPAVAADDLDTFADAFAAVSAPVNSAITAAYEMGITTGYSDFTFRPNNPVPRKNMASFITRALAHTNARPAGLTAQAVKAGVEVSVRDANFGPVANKVIDAFRAPTATAARAFKADGTCTAVDGALGSSVVETGTTKCVIDNIDPATGSAGNVSLAVSAAQVTADKGTTVWVWTGSMGDRVSATTDLYEVEISTAATPPPAATRAEVSSAFAGFDGAEALDNYDDNGRRAKYGTTVTIKIQLKADVDPDGDGGLPAAPVDAKPDADGDSYKVTITYPNGSTNVSTTKVGSDGSHTFSVTAADPDPKVKDAAASPTEITWLIERVDSTPTGDTRDWSPSLRVAGTTDDLATSVTGKVKFTDTAAVLHKVSAEAVNKMLAAPSANNSTVGNRLNVTATDQYGDAVGSVNVLANSTGLKTSDATGFVFPTSPRVTFSDGKVSFTYSYDKSANGATSQSIAVSGEKSRTTAAGTNAKGTPVSDCPDSGTYTYVVDNSPGGDETMETTATMVCTDITVLWTQNAANGSTGGNLLSADVDSNTLVMTTTVSGHEGPTVYSYDANDQFVDATANPITLAAFEDELKKRTGPGGTLGSITVASYTAGDASKVARFTFN